MLVKSYYGPGTSLFYPMGPAAAATGLPLTAHSPFGPSVTVNGAMPTMATAGGVGGGASFHHAHNLAAAAAAAAAAAQQQHQQQQQHSAVFHLAAPSTAKTSVSPSAVNLQPSGLGSSPNHSTVNSNAAKLGSPAAKKFRPAFTRPSHKGSRYIPKPIPQELGNLKTYSSPDILICGNCREMFNDLVDMMEHKRDYCKLRFTCKCDALHEDGDICATAELVATNNADPTINNEGSGPVIPTTSSSNTSSSSKQARPKWLHCVNCKSPFGNAWDLMVHVQTAHMMNIYQLADSTKLQNLQRQRASVSPSTSVQSSTSPLSSPIAAATTTVTNNENSSMPTCNSKN